MSPDPTSPHPEKVLGVAPGASDDEVRAAWLRAVRLFPPERHPAEFERIRDAYAGLRDPRSRARARLEAEDPFAPLAELYRHDGPARPYLGPGPWLEALSR